jgi:hypothetical protein
VTAVVALVSDLMDRSRLGAAVPGVRFVRDLAGVTADVVVVDLGRGDALAQLASLPPGAVERVVGYVAHVDAERADAARAAGCTEVVPRSLFFRRLPEL